MTWCFAAFDGTRPTWMKKKKNNRKAMVLQLIEAIIGLEFGDLTMKVAVVYLSSGLGKTISMILLFFFSQFCAYFLSNQLA